MPGLVLLHLLTARGNYDDYAVEAYAATDAAADAAEEARQAVYEQHGAGSDGTGTDAGNVDATDVADGAITSAPAIAPATKRALRGRRSAISPTPRTAAVIRTHSSRAVKHSLKSARNRSIAKRRRSPNKPPRTPVTKPRQKLRNMRTRLGGFSVGPLSRPWLGQAPVV